MMDKAAGLMLTVMLVETVIAGVSESVIVTVKENVPGVVGVPLRMPVLPPLLPVLDRERPSGSFPAVTRNVSCPRPPVV